MAKAKKEQPKKKNSEVTYKKPPKDKQFKEGNPGGPGCPPKFASPEQMQEAIDKYFEKCDARTRTIVAKDGGLIEVSHPEPYTVSGLCLTLGVDRVTLLNYSKESRFFSTVKGAKIKVANDVERRMLETQNQSGAIFSLKNNFGWKDEVGIDHSSKDGSMDLSKAITEAFSKINHQEKDLQ
jgi:hypothetical protein